MVGAVEGGVIKPELGELGQDFPLVGDERREDEVERGDAVRSDDEELLAKIIDIPHFALLEKGQFGDYDFRIRFFHGRVRIKKSR